MLFSKLFPYIEKFHPLQKAYNLPSAEIDSVNLLSDGQENFKTSILYIGLLSQLPSTPPCRLLNLLCIEDSKLSNSAAWEDIPGNFVIFEKNLKIDQLLNHILSAFEEEAAFCRFLDTMKNALYSGKGLQYIVDVATDFFENPIFINDTAYKLLAMSNNILYKNDTLESQKRLGYIHEDNVQSLFSDRVMNILSQSEEAVLINRTEPKEQWLFNNIKLRNIVIAVIAVADNNRPLTLFDKRLLEELSKIVSIEMDKTSFHRENSGIMHNYLLADLLEGKIERAETLEQRLRYLNWKIYPYYLVGVVTGRILSERKHQWLGCEICSILPDCHWTVYNKQFTFIISRPMPNILTTREEELLNYLLGTNHLVLGISEIYSNPLDIPHGYHHAVIASRYNMFNFSESLIIRYHDIVLFYIADLITDSRDIHDFKCPAVDHLYTYDQKHRSNLLPTLKCYLSNGNDSGLTAEKLHIHRNTLSYRLRKINEVSGLDFHDGMQLLHAHLYIMILVFQGKYLS